jgi:hypothetical protein
LLLNGSNLFFQNKESRLKNGQKRILTRASELKLKAKRPVGRHRKSWFSFLSEGIRKTGKSWQEIEMERW